jgi:hypothetical protein
MNKLHCKNLDNLKTDIHQLIDLKGKQSIIHSTTKVEDQNDRQLNMPSKYATILTCCFEKDRKTGLDVKILP